MVLMILAALFLALCLLGALHDINRLIIPNWLNLTLAGLFIPAAAFSGLPIEIIGGHLLIGLLAVVVSYGLFMLGVFGGGDAKMIMAVMFWMGPSGAVPFIFWMALAGGACALLVLTVRRSMPAAMVPGFMRASFEPKAGVPYGVAIAAGAILAGPHTPMLSGLFGAAGFVS